MPTKSNLRFKFDFPYMFHGIHKYSQRVLQTTELGSTWTLAYTRAGREYWFSIKEDGKYYLFFVNPDIVEEISDGEYHSRLTRGTGYYTERFFPEPDEEECEDDMSEMFDLPE